MLNRNSALAVIAILAAGHAAGQALTMGPPLGVTWGPVYALPPQKAEPFVAEARALGAGFSRVTLYWSQLEPKAGAPRWNELDAYIAQLSNPDEGLLTLSSASPWATKVASWVFPSSPAKTEADYYNFVRAVVAHSKGKIRYYQSDPEPNNPFFWNGTASEFAAQQKIFYRAVRDADPDAVVVLGGCDGLFDPTGGHPYPGQAANIAFFSTVIAEAAGSYDVFDLRLYGDPYTIPDRVKFVRELMEKAGAAKPIITTEYDGPSFFEFPANRRWSAQLQGPGASPEAVRRLMASAANLPIETRMYLPGAAEADVAHLQALQTDDLVVRNVLALASGIQRTAFFDLWHDVSQAEAPNTVLHGSFRLLEHEDGRLTKRLPLAAPFARLAELLKQASLVEHVEDRDHADVFIYKVSRRQQSPLWIAWRRPAKLGDDAATITVPAPWLPGSAKLSTVNGASRAGTKAELTLGASPLIIE